MEEKVGVMAETVTVAAAAAPGITNVQHAGVDEGDIVKLAGRYLVVLRRGRLFTIDVAPGALQPASAVDAFGPDVHPEETWYDEMLVSSRRVVVIGYSYQRGVPSDHAGTLGLPIRGPGRPGYEHLFGSSVSLVFLRNDALQLSELGELVSHPAEATDDGGRASCVDWYGNARPLFLEDRILALRGYEIVEGRLWNGRIEELRRVSFAPAAARAKD